MQTWLAELVTFFQLNYQEGNPHLLQAAALRARPQRLLPQFDAPVPNVKWELLALVKYLENTCSQRTPLLRRPSVHVLEHETGPQLQQLHLKKQLMNCEMLLPG